jgi:biotin carboxyl carrier protein
MGKTDIPEDKQEQEMTLAAAVGGAVDNTWARRGRVAIQTSHSLSAPLARIDHIRLTWGHADRAAAQELEGKPGIAIPEAVLRKRPHLRLQEDSHCRSPIAGLVIAVGASTGQEIQKGQPILIIEAMKMQNEVRAESDGVLKAVHVSPGDPVKAGQLLFELV